MRPPRAASTTIIHGTADDVVPDNHSRALEDALRKAGRVPLIATYYEGGGHGWSQSPTARTPVELADDLLRNARQDDDDSWLAVKSSFRLSPANRLGLVRSQ